MIRPTHILERLDNRANPVTVKELRQAFRGGWFGVILIVCLGTMICLLAATHFRSISTDEQAIGRNLFTRIAMLLQVAVVFGVPLYAGVRMSIEKMTGQVAIYYMTGLFSARIVNGKIKSALLLVILIVSSVAPFGFACTLMRGVGLPTVAASMVFTVCFGLIGCIGTVCLATQVASTLSAIVCLVFGGLCMAFLLSIATATQSVLIDMGPIDLLRHGAIAALFLMMPIVFTLAVLYSGALLRLRGVSPDPYDHANASRGLPYESHAGTHR